MGINGTGIQAALNARQSLAILASVTQDDLMLQKALGSKTEFIASVKPVDDDVIIISTSSFIGLAYTLKGPLKSDGATQARLMTHVILSVFVKFKEKNMCHRPALGEVFLHQSECIYVHIMNKPAYQHSKIMEALHRIQKLYCPKRVLHVTCESLVKISRRTKDLLRTTLSAY